MCGKPGKEYFIKRLINELIFKKEWRKILKLNGFKFYEEVKPILKKYPNFVFYDYEKPYTDTKWRAIFKDYQDYEQKREELFDIINNNYTTKEIEAILKEIKHSNSYT